MWLGAEARGVQWIPEQSGAAFSYEGIVDSGLIVALQTVEPAISEYKLWPIRISSLNSKYNPFLAAAELNQMGYAALVDLLRKTGVMKPVLFDGETASHPSYQKGIMGLDQNRVTDLFRQSLPFHVAGFQRLYPSD